MNLAQFKDWALAQGSVAKYNDGQFKGECVSLVNQYCYRVLDVPAGAWGHAKDWATNATALTYFNKVSDLQPGDILVYGMGEYGHIEIALGGGQALGQNRNLDGKTRVAPVLKGYIVILRSKKGEKMANISTEQVVELSLATTGRQPSNDDETKFIGRELTPANVDGLLQQWRAKSRIPDLEALVNAQKAKIAELEESGQYIKVSDLYIKK